jgi:acyl-CoA thioesterase FadM
MLEPVALRLPVRPNDLDSLGHVNNAVVLEYFETGRWAWMDRQGIGRTRTLVPVVSRIEVNYLKPVLGGMVEVNTRLFSRPEDPETSYQVVFQQCLAALTDTGPVPAAEAMVRVAFLDTRESRLCSLREYLEHAGAQPWEIGKP